MNCSIQLLYVQVCLLPNVACRGLCAAVSGRVCAGQSQFCRAASRARSCGNLQGIGIKFVVLYGWYLSGDDDSVL